MSDEPESLLQRWSRRKALAREGGPSEDRDAERREPCFPPDAPPNLPDPEILAADADFSVYLRNGVDGALQRTALRRLWRLDPIFSVRDGLLDYDEDFTDAAKAPAVLRTAWRIGSGLTGGQPESSQPSLDAGMRVGVPGVERLGGAEGAGIDGEAGDDRECDRQDDAGQERVHDNLHLPPIGPSGSDRE